MYEINVFRCWTYIAQDCEKGNKQGEPHDCSCLFLGSNFQLQHREGDQTEFNDFNKLRKQRLEFKVIRQLGFVRQCTIEKRSVHRRNTRSLYRDPLESLLLLLLVLNYLAAH